MSAKQQQKDDKKKSTAATTTTTRRSSKSKTTTCIFFLLIVFAVISIFHTKQSFHVTKFDHRRDLDLDLPTELLKRYFGSSFDENDDNEFFDDDDDGTGFFFDDDFSSEMQNDHNQQDGWDDEEEEEVEDNKDHSMLGNIAVSNMSEKGGSSIQEQQNGVIPFQKKLTRHKNQKSSSNNNNDNDDKNNNNNNNNNNNEVSQLIELLKHGNNNDNNENSQSIKNDSNRKEILQRLSGTDIKGGDVAGLVIANIITREEMIQLLKEQKNNNRNNNNEIQMDMFQMQKRKFQEKKNFQKQQFQRQRINLENRNKIASTIGELVGKKNNKFLLDTNTNNGRHSHHDLSVKDAREQLLNRVIRKRKRNPGGHAKAHHAPTPEELEQIRQSTEAFSAKTNGRIMYFLHIHKAGGTTMCHMARKSFISANPRNNCNVQADQRCCGKSDTLQAQIDFATTTKYKFVANEGDMYKDMAPDHYVYVMTLRNSQSRYHSHWNHVRRSVGPLVSGSFIQWYQAQPDNWTARKVCGTHCSEIAKFQITRHDFETIIMKRMEIFEDFIFVESFEESYTKFAQKWGWNAQELRALNVARHKRGSDNNDKDVWDPLMSALDDALYDYAQRRQATTTTTTTNSNNRIDNKKSEWFSIETNQRLDDYFNHGKSVGCENPCCAIECSKYR